MSPIRAGGADVGEKEAGESDIQLHGRRDGLGHRHAGDARADLHEGNPEQEPVEVVCVWVCV